MTGTFGNVTLNGTATVQTTLIHDEFGGAPTLLVSVHVNNVTGHKGASPNVTTLQGGGEAVLVRPLGSSDRVQVSVSLDPPGTISGTQTKTVMANLALSLDPVTGAALGASGVLAQ